MLGEGDLHLPSSGRLRDWVVDTSQRLKLWLTGVNNWVDDLVVHELVMEAPLNWCMIKNIFAFVWSGYNNIHGIQYLNGNSLYIGVT